MSLSGYRVVLHRHGDNNVGAVRISPLKSQPISNKEQRTGVIESATKTLAHRYAYLTSKDDAADKKDAIRQEIMAELDLKWQLLMQDKGYMLLRPERVIDGGQCAYAEVKLYDGSVIPTCVIAGSSRSAASLSERHVIISGYGHYAPSPVTGIREKINFDVSLPCPDFQSNFSGVLSMAFGDDGSNDKNVSRKKGRVAPLHHGACKDAWMYMRRKEMSSGAIVDGMGSEDDENRRAVMSWDDIKAHMCDVVRLVMWMLIYDGQSKHPPIYNAGHDEYWQGFSDENMMHVDGKQPESANIKPLNWSQYDSTYNRYVVTTKGGKHALRLVSNNTWAVDGYECCGVNMRYFLGSIDVVNDVIWKKNDGGSNKNGPPMFLLEEPDMIMDNEYVYTMKGQKPVECLDKGIPYQIPFVCKERQDMILFGIIDSGGDPVKLKTNKGRNVDKVVSVNRHMCFDVNDPTNFFTASDLEKKMKKMTGSTDPLVTYMSAGYHMWGAYRVPVDIDLTKMVWNKGQSDAILEVLQDTNGAGRCNPPLISQLLYENDDLYSGETDERVQSLLLEMESNMYRLEPGKLKFVNDVVSIFRNKLSELDINEHFYKLVSRASSVQGDSANHSSIILDASTRVSQHKDSSRYQWMTCEYGNYAILEAMELLDVLLFATEGSAHGDDS